MSEIEIPQFNCRRMLRNGDIEAIWLYTYTGVLAWLNQEPDLRAVVYHTGEPLPYPQLLAEVAQFNPATVQLDERDSYILASEFAAKRRSQD